MRTSRFTSTVSAVMLLSGLLGLAGTSAAAAPSKPVIKSLTIATSSTDGGVLTTIRGTGLAAAACASPSPCTAVSFTVGSSPAIAATSVRALSADVLQVVVPASAVAGRAAVTVTPVDGSAVTRSSAVTYTAVAPEVIASNGVPISSGLLTGSPSSDTPTPGQKLTGTGLTGATLLIGGVSVRPTSTTATTITYTAPVAAPGPRAVVVKTAGGSVDAGILMYSGVVPVVDAIRDAGDTSTVTAVSPGRATQLVVRGTGLKVVKTAVLRDTTGTVADQALTVGAAASDGTTLRVAAPTGLRAVASGNVVLRSAFASSATTSASALATRTGSAPTLDAGMVLVGGTTALSVTGTALGDLLSIRYDSRTIDLSAVSAASAGGFTVTVPAPIATASDATANLVVTTDFGTATRSVAVPVPPRLSQLLVDASANTATLITTKPLASGPLGPDQVAQLVYTSTRSGEQVPITPLSAVVTGSSLVATFEDGDLEVGDVVTASYALSGSAGHHLAAAAVTSGTLVATSVPLRVTVPVSFGSASRDAVSGVVTVTGQGLSAGNEVTLTSTTTSSSLTPPGSSVTAASTTSPRSTTLTFPGPTVPGTYTVTVKTAPGGTAVAGPPTPVTVVVPVPSYSGATRDPDTGVVTVTGTSLSRTNEFSLVPSYGSPVSVSSSVLTVAGDGLTASFAGPAEVGAWTVAMKVANRGASVAPSGAAGFTVAAPVFSSLTADAATQRLTLPADLALATVSAPGSGRTGQFSLTRDRCSAGASDVSSAITGLSVAGSVVTLTVSPGTVAAGDALTASYVPGAAGALLKSAAGTPVASASGLTTSLPLPVRSFTGVTRDLDTGDVSLDGSGLASTNIAVVTGTGGYRATPSVSGGGTSLTLAFSGSAPSASGTYTVELRESPGCGKTLGTQTFTI